MHSTIFHLKMIVKVVVVIQQDVQMKQHLTMMQMLVLMIALVLLFQKDVLTLTHLTTTMMQTQMMNLVATLEVVLTLTHLTMTHLFVLMMGLVLQQLKAVQTLMQIISILKPIQMMKVVNFLAAWIQKHGITTQMLMLMMDLVSLVHLDLSRIRIAMQQF